MQTFNAWMEWAKSELEKPMPDLAERVEELVREYETTMFEGGAATVREYVFLDIRRMLRQHCGLNTSPSKPTEDNDSMLEEVRGHLEEAYKTITGLREQLDSERRVSHGLSNAMKRIKKALRCPEDGNCELEVKIVMQELDDVRGGELEVKRAAVAKVREIVGALYHEDVVEAVTRVELMREELRARVRELEKELEVRDENKKTLMSQHGLEGETFCSMVWRLAGEAETARRLREVLGMKACDGVVLVATVKALQRRMREQEEVVGECQKVITQVHEALIGWTRPGEKMVDAIKRLRAEQRCTELRAQSAERLASVHSFLKHKRTRSLEEGLDTWRDRALEAEQTLQLAWSTLLFSPAAGMTLSEAISKLRHEWTEMQSACLTAKEEARILRDLKEKAEQDSKELRSLIVVLREKELELLCGRAQPASVVLPDHDEVRDMIGEVIGIVQARAEKDGETNSLFQDIAVERLKWVREKIAGWRQA